MFYRITVEVVDYKPFATGSRSLHFLHGGGGVDCDDALSVTAGVYACIQQFCVPALFFGESEGNGRRIHVVVVYNRVAEQSLACSFLNRYIGTAERPAGAVVHVDTDIPFFSPVNRVTQHLHPLR